MEKTISKADNLSSEMHKIGESTSKIVHKGITLTSNTFLLRCAKHRKNAH